MKELFYAGLVLFIVLHGVKIMFALGYWRKWQEKACLSEVQEENISIVQPILSGDPSLESNLVENLRNSDKANFIWLIDKSDAAAQTITERIIAGNPKDSSRITVLQADDVPQGLNPKIYKLNYSTPYLKPYTVILDDDTVIQSKQLQQAVKLLEQRDGLITGIPYYRSQGGFYSSLVTAFVNANSLFTYFSMAYVTQPKTINGMFYITSSEILNELNAFPSIEDKLCDDLEMAKLFRQHQIPIIQSVIPCKVTTTVTDISHYIKLMKRWMVFANQFLKEQVSVYNVLIVMLPALLPAFMLAISMMLGTKFLFLFGCVHVIKAYATSRVRRRLLNNTELRSAMFFECIADYLQIIHYVHALVSPRTIQWRKRHIQLDNDRLRFK